MKKLFAFILLLASLSVGCVLPTVGAFAMGAANTSMDHNMNHDMSWDMWMDMQSEGDSDDMHECCESPFLDSLTRNEDVSVWENNVDNDTEVLYFVHESIIQNTHNKLNSPPWIFIDKNISVKNSYTSLVGIIKNNA